jgi:hypothetical protein
VKRNAFGKLLFALLVAAIVFAILTYVLRASAASIADVPPPLDLLSTGFAVMESPVGNVSADLNCLQASVANNIRDTVIFYGNRSGVYTQSQVFPATNSFVISNLDDRLPWFFASANCYISIWPVSVNCFTNKVATNCVTNWLMVGDLSNELMLCDSNLLPFLTVSNGIAAVTGWGKSGHHYTVFAGNDFTALTNDVFETDGADGLWTCSEPVTSAMRFYRTEVQ